jgi:hypothetical protein
METFDIILDGGELIEENGDFKRGDNANNLISYIVQANNGEYKEYPELGVGILTYLNGNKNIQEIERDIINELKADVFPDPDVDMDDYPSTIRINKVSFELNS